MFRIALIIFFILSQIAYAQQIRVSGINSPVRANVQSGTGTAITSTTLGSNELLDVNVDTGTVIATLPGPIEVFGDVIVEEPVSVDDNSGSLTVDGTVAVSDITTGLVIATVNNENLPAIRTAVQSIDETVYSNNEITFDKGILVYGEDDSATPKVRPLLQESTTRGLYTIPRGSDAAIFQQSGGTETSALRVTVATDSTGLLSVDDNGGSLTTDVDTGTIVATIVDPLTVTIKDGGDSHTVDIGEATTGSSDLAKAEDAVHATGDVGIMSLAVRNDTLAALGGTDGDYAPLQVSPVGGLYIEGGAADGASAIGNPVQIAGHDFLSTTMAIPTMFTAADITMNFTHIMDSSGGLALVSNSGLFITGDEAHDVADAGSPVKIGGKATDTDPSQNEGSIAPVGVAENDRVDTWFNTSGALVEAVHPESNALDGIEGEYITGALTRDSGIVNTWFFRQATIGFDLTKNGSPTDLTFDVFCSNDRTTFREQKLMNGALGAWIYDDTAVGASGINRSYTFPIMCYQMKVRATCVGCTTAGATSFTIDNAILGLRN